MVVSIVFVLDQVVMPRSSASQAFEQSVQELRELGMAADDDGKRILARRVHELTESLDYLRFDVERAREIREGKNLSERDLDRLLELPCGSVRDIEQGRTQPIIGRGRNLPKYLQWLADHQYDPFKLKGEY